MNSITTLKTTSDLFPFFKLKSAALHPQVAIIDFSEVKRFIDEYIKISTSFYCLIFKNYNRNNVKYGRKVVDFQNGSLICLAPNQILEMEPEVEVDESLSGWGLFVHPDLFLGTSMANRIMSYSFFEYQTNEALHLSEAEKQTLSDCVARIKKELTNNIDRHSQALIVSLIEVLLNYCVRFYDRQFITRKKSNVDVVTKFELLLKDYFNDDSLKNIGLPTVQYFADKLFLSANYFSDLMKKETGKNAKEHIQYYMIELAKKYLLDSDAPVNEIAYELGFEYPQYFSRLFKSKTGMTPAEYRSMN
ncbi:MAG TPA: helix-turn-helix transcriptional regulator [Ohtaekwangia sp.]|uniref:helix-turn-helix domain-containing protein n=1 Tax=Ohtaekwangia sp. TaxID=2066019 RepID=UPI002F947990